MSPDRVEIALTSFFNARAKARLRRQSRVRDVVSNKSSAITICLFLIYYFSLCDFILKFLPINIAIVLRYLPEALLYVIALAYLRKRREAGTFPLLWPLCFCALSMTISAVLNSVSLVTALVDFRLYFRFAAFAYIAWKTEVTSQNILSFMKGFLGLTVIQLAVGTFEMVGGEPVQLFFAPILGLASGNAGIAVNQLFGELGWIFGTLQNYNNFGMFMSMSCVIALGVYVVDRRFVHLGLAVICGVFVVLSFSRHSLLTLLGAVLCFSVLRTRKNTVRRLVQGIIVGSLLLIGAVEVARVAYPELEERLATVVDPDVMATDSTANIRFFIMAALPPRFLTSYPLFGQGPIVMDKNQYGDERDIWLAPPLKGAPDLPGVLTYYLADVVWVMILGFYGLAGLAGFFYLFWMIARSANRIRNEEKDPKEQMLAQVCLSVMAAYIISGFFSEEMVARDCIPVFWVLAGLTMSLSTSIHGRDRTIGSGSNLYGQATAD